MIRILFTDGAKKSCIDALKSKGFDVVEQFYEPLQLEDAIKNFDVIVIRAATKITKSIIDAACDTKKLKLIIRGGVGVDNIDVEYAKSKGIEVKNTPGACSSSVAELVLGHMLCLSRFIYISNVTMRQGEWNKKNYEGIELAGKTLGIVGFGRIGKDLAQKCSLLGMNIVYTDIIGENKDFINYKYYSLDDLLSKSDFISLHVPYTSGQKSLIGAAEFAKMKDGVYIINCARGKVIDENELLNALDSGKVAGAALDVFNEEPTKNKKLLTHNKISFSPHIGASTSETQNRIGQEIVNIILKYFEHN